jgi:FkbM family methyltransferase
MNEVRRFSDDTGMYIDWNQLKDLPEIDTLIDVGVGPGGTPELYERFGKAGIVLIDPLAESKSALTGTLQNRKATFVCAAAGKINGQRVINVESTLERSTFLSVTSINFESEPVEQRLVEMRTLDQIVGDVEKSQFGPLGSLGIKIDTEGFELSIILGAQETLKNAKFVIAEVRHNHVTYDEGYKLHEFGIEMSAQGYVLTKIFTAKPFIADLCYQPIADLN